MYYHGSKVQGIKTLYPNLSLHNEKYVYLTTNKAVALIYTVNAIESFYEANNLKKPSNFQPWYSYGFDKELVPVIEEYYPDATIETYSGKSGYIYVCKQPKNYENPTNIHCAIVTKEEVYTLEEYYIKDVYKEILEMEKLGLIKIKRYEFNCESYLNNIYSMIKDDIEKNSLNTDLESNYSIFLRAKFPSLF
ncbi:MAG: hypothetical protein PHC62_02365 [Candidatus Izemoplasmatales bacterium]|jgi:hypothetical protein|nr:hypothetical protein [Candidatus Izemoplasmatales bacterium]